MIKIDENITLKLILNKRVDELQNYVENEILKQKPLDTNPEKSVSRLKRFCNQASYQSKHKYGVYEKNGTLMVSAKGLGIILDPKAWPKDSIEEILQKYEAPKYQHDLKSLLPQDTPSMGYSEVRFEKKELQDLMKMYSRITCTQSEDSVSLRGTAGPVKVSCIKLKQIHEMLNLSNCKVRVSYPTSPVIIEHVKATIILMPLA